MLSTIESLGHLWGLPSFHWIWSLLQHIPTVLLRFLLQLILWYVRMTGQGNKVSKTKIGARQDRDYNSKPWYNSPPEPPCCSNTVLPEYTFVNVRRQSTHKHLAGISFHSLPVLVSKAVRWTQATMKRLIPTAIIQETIFHRKQWRLTWNRKQNRKLIGRAPCH